MMICCCLLRKDGESGKYFVVGLAVTAAAALSAAQELSVHIAPVLGCSDLEKKNDKIKDIYKQNYGKLQMYFCSNFSDFHKAFSISTVEAAGLGHLLES